MCWHLFHYTANLSRDDHVSLLPSFTSSWTGVTCLNDANNVSDHLPTSFSVAFGCCCLSRIEFPNQLMSLPALVVILATRQVATNQLSVTTWTSSYIRWDIHPTCSDLTTIHDLHSCFVFLNLIAVFQDGIPNCWRKVPCELGNPWAKLRIEIHYNNMMSSGMEDR